MILKDNELNVTEVEKKALMLKDLGMEVTINDYKQLPDLLPVTLCYFLIFLVAMALFPLNPILTFVITLLVLVGYYFEVNGKLMLSYFLTLGKKQSILAKLPCKISRKKIVFIIPKYYVNLSKLYLKNRSYIFMKKLSMFFIIALAIFTIGFFHSMVNKSPVMGYWYFSILITLPMLAYALIVFWKSFFGPQPVAKNTSYAESLMIDIIKKLTGEGELDSCNIYLFFTQDRSGDYSAIIDLLDNHEDELQGARIINLDFFDGGKIVINQYEGILKRFRTCQRLSMAIIGLSSRLGFSTVKIVSKITMFSPLTLFLSRGYDGINLISQGKTLGEKYDHQLFFKELIYTLDDHL